MGLVSAWMAGVAVVVGAQQPSGSAPSGALSGEKPASQPVVLDRYQRADRVMSLSCSVSGCHTVRPIETAAKDREGWIQTVNAMIGKGAKIESEEDKDLLIEILVRDHGPLPDGDGKKILLQICTICHDLQKVRRSLFTPDGWKGVLEEMIVGGAPLTDDNFEILLTYLSTNFRPAR